MEANPIHRAGNRGKFPDRRVAVVVCGSSIGRRRRVGHEIRHGVEPRGPIGTRHSEGGPARIPGNAPGIDSIANSGIIDDGGFQLVKGHDVGGC